MEAGANAFDGAWRAARKSTKAEKCEAHKYTAVASAGAADIAVVRSGADFAEAASGVAARETDSGSGSTPKAAVAEKGAEPQSAEKCSQSALQVVYDGEKRWWASNRTSFPEAMGQLERGAH